MSIAKFAGIETEFAITGGEPIATSAAVVAAYRDLPLGDGTGEPRPNPAVGPLWDLMLPNGARYYVDHAHPEYATAESADARTVVAMERAGAELVRRCAALATDTRARTTGERRPIAVYKNNSDHQGHSYGCHENYLLDAGTFAALFGERAEWLHAYLIPFLVSRIVITGSGKVGAENGMEPAAFQISQRADFFETLVGLQTTEARPIVNTRDEPHADPTRFRRLHVIAGDANMCPVAGWLKIGTMQLVLRMLEDGALRGGVPLADPLRAIRELSRDPTCRRAVRLENGRAVTAVEMQSEFLSAALAYFGSRPASDGEALVLEHWAQVLNGLADDPDTLVGALDWVTKRRVLVDLQSRQRWNWSDPRALEADVKYHALAPDESIFGMLERRGLIQYPPGWDAAAEHRLMRQPPAASRALLRGWCIDRCSSEIRSANWGEVAFRTGTVALPDLVGVDEAAIGAMAAGAAGGADLPAALVGVLAATATGRDDRMEL